ncbi:MAG TPA: glycosyltransferase family 39 protein [Streptosporangiaceae bacterium]
MRSPLSVPAGPDDREPGPAPLPEFARAGVLTIAALLAVLLIAFAGRYGYHRDELYFIACGQHLAWGYPDQPPLVPAVARLMSAIARDSVLVLRLPAVAAAAALVVLTGLLTRELGGGRAAQVLAAAAMAVSVITLSTGHLLSTSTFDLPVSALLLGLILRILRTGQSRLWLAVGLLAGAGLLDTDLVALLMFSAAAGLLIAGPRWPFTSPWLYAGGVIALAMWTPYLVWQGTHGWPELAVAHSIASGGSGTSAPRWAVPAEQLVLISVFLAPVLIAGLVRLFRDRARPGARALAVAYVVLLVVIMATGGKPYYTAGMAAPLAAAGAQPAVDWMRRGRARLRTALIAAALVLSLTNIYIALPVVPAADLKTSGVLGLNYDAGETVGWPAFVAEIAAVYRGLPAAQRPGAVILASNYGEAGAVQHFGPDDRLRAAVYGVHNAYWYWGPPPAAAATAVAVGFGRSQLSRVCGSLRLAARLNNHLNVPDDEQGAPVWVCSDLRMSWAAAWPGLRYLG